MYTSFYKLNTDPFRLTPDSRFFFASNTHNRGLSYLRYAFHQHEGFVVITGAPGTGKTELMLNLISALPRHQVIVSKIVTANLHADDLLDLVAASFLPAPISPGKGLLLKKLEDFFVTQAGMGKQLLLLIDEAHNLSTKALIELSMLSNFQIDAKPVLQCFLMGQESLEQKLEQPELVHLKQRVIASTHLHHLDAQETQAYIEHRLGVAGWQGDPHFSDSAYALIHEYTSGVPRRINAACSRILLESYLEEKHSIDIDVVYKVIEELQEDSFATQNNLPQMSLTLDFSANAEAEQPGAEPTPQPVHATEQASAAAADKPAVAAETSNVIDMPALGVNKAALHSTHLNLAAAWPMTDADPLDSVAAEPGAETAPQLDSAAQGTVPSPIPNNVHALFVHPQQWQQQTTPITEDLVVALPEDELEEEPETNPIDMGELEAVIDAEEQSLMIDDLTREQHRHLDQLHSHAAKDVEPFNLRAFLEQFAMSNTGLVTSLTLLVILWWFLYGPGTGSTVQILNGIATLFH